MATGSNNNSTVTPFITTTIIITVVILTFSQTLLLLPRILRVTSFNNNVFIPKNQNRIHRIYRHVSLVTNTTPGTKRFVFAGSSSSLQSSFTQTQQDPSNQKNSRSNDNGNKMSGRGGRGRGGGRGEYYKNKYGGGGRGGRGGGGRGGGRGGHGGGGGGGGGGGNDGNNNDRPASGGGSYDDLQRLLQRLDGKSYPAYHDLDTPLTRGWYNPSLNYTLFVERAQSDPFAPPTRCRIVVDGRRAGFPPSLYSNPVRSMALGDFLLRNLYNSCKKLGADASLGGGGGGGGWQGPKGGDIQVLEPCQHILEQSAVRIDRTDGSIVAQVTLNLPARGRTILGRAAEQILGYTLPTMVEQSLYYANLPSRSELQKHGESVEDQVWLQRQLESRNLVAFVRNDAILPRVSGDDDRPMNTNQAVPFESPKRMEVSFTLPNAGTNITGMGVPKGISLICGGGFHGKSTLLSVLQNGIYPKVVGDGREFCVVDPNACKIRAEDGRNVQANDISNFINNLPYGKDTTNFSTMDASGSTSQAAFIQESIECGATTFLIDEDTCATNFMIRDDKMIQLVAPEKEPITPFVRLVRSLYDDVGISTILVVGGTGDFFDVADTVLVMDSYHCIDATERAKQIVANSTSDSSMPHKASQGVVYQRSSRKRVLKGAAFNPNGKVKTISRSSVSYADTELNLACMEQLVSKSQTVAIVNALQRLPSICKDGQSIQETLKEIDRRLDEEGLDALSPGHCHGGMSRPRHFEIAGAINRLRRNGGIYQQR